MNRRTILNSFLVLVASLLVLGSARAQQDDLQRINAEFLAAYEAKDWPTAIERGKELTAALPEDPAVAYNLACVYALGGESKLAVKWLSRSVELGFENGEQLRTDPDLASVRSMEAYGDVLRDFESRSGRVDSEFEKLLAGSEPLILTPPDHDPTVPATVIVALHGYGVDANDIGPTWQGPAAHIGAVVVAPRTVRRAVGTDGFTWGTVQEAERIVLHSLEIARRKLAVDPERLVLTGFSQGGYMSLNLSARHPELFRGVIPVAAFYRPAEAPFREAGEGRAPRYYMMIGDRDSSLENNREAVGVLKAKGYPAELVVFEGLGHSFPPEPEAAMHTALHFVLD